MYLGFAARSGMDELEQSLEELREQYASIQQRLAELTAQPTVAVVDAEDPGPASPAPAVDTRVARPLATQRAIAQTEVKLAKLERKIEARSKALPLYEATLGSEELIQKLRSQRDHPVHTLLRRMYYEMRTRNSTTSSSGHGATAPRFHGRIS